jgi:hypothetical protein
MYQQDFGFCCVVIWELNKVLSHIIVLLHMINDHEWKHLGGSWTKSALLGVMITPNNSAPIFHHVNNPVSYSRNTRQNLFLCHERHQIPPVPWSSKQRMAIHSLWSLRILDHTLPNPLSRFLRAISHRLQVLVIHTCPIRSSYHSTIPLQNRLR